MLTSKFSGTARQLQTDRPLTEQEIARVAPSVFASSAHATRSDRYQHIPTIDVLQGLQREGFRPFMVAQQRSRKADRVGFAKHMFRPDGYAMPWSGRAHADPAANTVRPFIRQEA